MSFADHIAADRRLTMLRLLEKSTGYAANEYLLQSALEDFGHQVGRDRLRTDLSWLAEQGLVELKTTGGVDIATLTTRGADVSAGRATVPGVKRPAPGE